MRTSTLTRSRDTAMVRLYALVMIVTTGLAVVVALLVTRTDPQYSASGEILIGPTITSSGNYIQPSMPTEQRLATSAEVISVASARLGASTENPLGDLSVTVPVDTQVLVMAYTADTPEEALDGAKTFMRTFLEIRNPEKSDPVASQVSPPVLPSSPLAPSYPIVLGVAVLGGLLIGFGVARAWDKVRGRIRTIDDAERCSSLGALALMPYLPRRSTDDDQEIWVGCPPIDSLAARVLSQVEDSSKTSLLVTGASPRSGSTSVAALTAVSLARLGRVVVLVTADAEVAARMSRDHDLRAGEDAPWPNARATEQDGLLLVSMTEWDSAGVAAARLTNLLPELHDNVPEALIVIDGPLAWRSAGMALRADKILMVVGLGRSSRTAVTVGVQAMAHGADKMMGLVVTPRPRRVREGLIGARALTSRLIRRVMFRISPVSGGLAPAAPAVELDRIRDVGRRPTLPPSNEPSGSVAS